MPRIGLRELFPMHQKNPCANANDALFHAGFRLQASERNIKGLKFWFHGTITQADAMTLSWWEGECIWMKYSNGLILNLYTFVSHFSKVTKLANKIQKHVTKLKNRRMHGPLACVLILSFNETFYLEVFELHQIENINEKFLLICLQYLDVPVLKSKYYRNRFESGFFY